MDDDDDEKFYNILKLYVRGCILCVYYFLV